MTRTRTADQDPGAGSIVDVSRCILSDLYVSIEDVAPDGFYLQVRTRPQKLVERLFSATAHITDLSGLNIRESSCRSRLRTFRAAQHRLQDFNPAQHSERGFFFVRYHSSFCHPSQLPRS